MGCTMHRLSGGVPCIGAGGVPCTDCWGCTKVDGWHGVTRHCNSFGCDGFLKGRVLEEEEILFYI